MFYYSKTLLFEVLEGPGRRRFGDFFRAWVSGGAFEHFLSMFCLLGRFWSPEGDPLAHLGLPFGSINGAFVDSCLEGRFQVAQKLTLGRF